MAAFIEDKTFGKAEWHQNNQKRATYENCTFHEIDFTNDDLSDFKFIDCIFKGCNLSTAKITGTSFQTVHFTHCKLLGLHFDTCNKFGFAVKFTNCVLNHSVFYSCKLKKTNFVHCELVEVDFSQSDLTEGFFDNCNLTGAVFEQTNLQKADFRTASNYNLDPDNNPIKGAKFSLDGLRGLLNKYQIVIE
jgi:fluoroquinolone resistance protein